MRRANASHGSGGGISVDQADVTLWCPTVAANQAGMTGAGGAIALLGASAAVTFRGAIVWANVDSNGSGLDEAVAFVNGAAATQLSWHTSDLQDWGGGAWNTAYGNDGIGSTGTNMMIDPAFSMSPTPSSTGTTAGNFHLTGNSLASLGDDAIISEGITEDLDHQPRLQGAGVDMGVYEIPE